MTGHLDPTQVHRSAMAPEDAVDVQALLLWLLDPHALDDTAAQEAAGRLADRSAPGLPDPIEFLDVEQGWPNLLQGCPGCSDCARTGAQP